MFNKLVLFLGSIIFTFSAFAKPIEVPVFWGFSLSSDSGIMVKNLIDSANTKQSKYKFILTHRPGSAGSIAVNSMMADDKLSILVHSSSFYIRPIMYKENYDPRDFSMTNSICVDQPLGIISTKYTKMSDIENLPITVGIIPGSITTLVTGSIIKNNNNFNFKEIPYKTTPEATTDMLGGHINSSVDFLGQATFSRLPSDAKVLGITGTVEHNGMRTFKSQGIKGLEEVKVGYYLYVKKTLPSDTQSEISKIFYAAVDNKVKHHCETDFGRIQNVAFDNLQNYHINQIEIWNTIIKQ